MPVDFLGFGSAVVGGIVALAMDYARRAMFAPRFRLECEPVGKEFVRIALVPGPVKVGDDHLRVRACYVRISVKNESQTSAKSCRAYLTGIKNLCPGGHTTETGFADSIRLRWAYEGRDGELHGGIDIPHEVTVYFDVFSSQEAAAWPEGQGPAEGATETRILEVAPRNARESPDMVNLLKMNASYRFSVMVMADGVSPKLAELDVELGRRWNEIKVIRPLKVGLWDVL